MAYDGNRSAAAAQPEWLTLGQAAKYLGVAQSTMRKWSDLGRVSAFYTPGGHRRYRRSDLDQFLDRSGTGRSAATPTSGGPLVLIVDDDEGAARVRPRQPRGRGLRGPRGGKRRGRARGARRAFARPDPARRDDAAGRRLGDAAADPGAHRRRRDPGDHVLRARSTRSRRPRPRRAASRASSASRSTPAR